MPDRRVTECFIVEETKISVGNDNNMYYICGYEKSVWALGAQSCLGML